MSLRSDSTYPSFRCYVIKLHRDAQPAAGQLSGRVEHVASGEQVQFDSAAELAHWLAAHADRIDAARALGDTL